jgi:hypothetical protein
MRRTRTTSTAHALAATGAALLAAAGLTLRALPVQAVSGGGYNPQQQGCSTTADRNDQPQSTQPGCHNATLQLNQGGGGYANDWHVLSINSDQLPNGESPHSGSVVLDPGQGTTYTITFETGTGQLILVSPLGLAVDLLAWAGGGFQGPPPIPAQLIGTPGTPGAGPSQSSSATHAPTDGLGQEQVYFGADDNLDNGEHDGVNPTVDHNKDAQVADGPSDGGAAQANTHPQGSVSDPQSLSQNVDPTDAHNPIRAADLGTGACADGLCVGADTSHRKAYQGGCTSCPDQSVYNDQYTTQWRSPDCNSGSTANQNDCGADWQNGNESGNIYQPYSERGAYYTDPGVFVYEDPDPQSSPVFPVDPTYPMCELYAGTMGVWVCSQNVVPSPVEAIGGATGAGSGTGAPAKHGKNGGPAARPATTSGADAQPAQRKTTGGATATPAPATTSLLPALPQLPPAPTPPTSGVTLLTQ